METIQNSTVFVGTELKLNINIQPIGGIHINDDRIDFTIEAFCTSKGVVTIKKTDAIFGTSSDDCIILVDTSVTGPGSLKCKIVLEVEDADFTDTKRTEVALIDTGIKIIRI